MIKLVRIDYRLLHGQVAFAWANNLNINAILIANDAVANDDMRKSSLRLAKPSYSKLIFKSIDDSADAINSGVTDDYRLMVVVENVHDAFKLASKVKSISRINLGLSQKREDTQMIAKAVYITEKEQELINQLIDQGIEVYLQQSPNDQSINVKKKV